MQTLKTPFWPIRVVTKTGLASVCQSCARSETCRKTTSVDDEIIAEILNDIYVQS